MVGPIYGLHPDWAKIDWSKASWTLDGEQFTPDPAKSLADNGIGHKSVLRLTTPGLERTGRLLCVTASLAMHTVTIEPLGEAGDG